MPTSSRPRVALRVFFAIVTTLVGSAASAATTAGARAVIESVVPAAKSMRLPEPARFRAARGNHGKSDAAKSDAIVRGAAAAVGLHSINIGSFRGGLPAALYGDGSSSLPGRSSVERADAFLQAFSPAYGLSPADLKNVSKAERSGFAPGHREVVMSQTAGGRRLYGAELRLHLGERGEFVAAVGQLYGNLRWSGGPTMTGNAARNRAAALIDRLLPPTDNGPVRRANADDAGLEEIAYPLGDVATPAFVLTGVMAANNVDMFDVVIDGQSGELLEIVPRTFYAQGQVFRNGAGQPQSPQPSATPGVAPPSPNPPSYVSRVTISFDPFLSGTTLSGNNANVREFQTWTGTSLSSSSGNAVTSLNSDFSFTANLGPNQPDIRNYPLAAATNLFYLLNFAHDYFYALGFDEARGNFQVNNFGLGGLGNDAVLGFAQLGSGLPTGGTAYAASNASMTTPNDGSAPTMRMYVFSRNGSPGSYLYRTDSSFDPDIVLHEFTHGVTQRLCPGYLPYQGQSGAFNEGNSDFFALNIQIPDGSPAAGAYPVGTYAVQNFTWGIRYFPYSTSMATDPLTYADFGFVWWGGPEVHADGEIWANVLWEMRTSLVGTYGFATGRTRASQLVIDALQLLPDAPTYTDFRNAILTSDQARYGGADVSAIWTAFAKRGIGQMADGSYDGYCTHVLADTSTPSPAARIRLWESAVYPGETVRVDVGDSNAAASDVVLWTSSGDFETFGIGASGYVFKGEIPSTSGVPVIGDGTLQLTPGDVITARTTDASTGGATPVLSTTSVVHGPYSMTMAPSMFDVSSATTLLFNADDGDLNRSLPFSFPFFGQTYDAAWINSNGVISFGGPLGYAPRSLTETGLPPALSPFAADLDCSTFASGAVYEYATTSRYTIRWACTEWSTINSVNVALTLFPDGTFRFDYGTGNTLTAPLYSGGPIESAMVGVVRGTDTFSQAVSGHSGSRNLNLAQSVTFAPTSDQAVPVCPAAFSDSTLTPTATPIRAVHVLELRPCVNLLRTSAGLSRITFTDPSLSGLAMKATHLMELRTGLDVARQALGLPPVSYGRGTISSGMTILASDIQEIRNGVR